MINIFGPINHLGYGTHTYNIIKALSKKTQVCLIPIEQIQLDESMREVIDMTNKRDLFSVKNPSLFIFHEPEAVKYCGTPALAYSIFETDVVNNVSAHILEHGPTDKVLTTTKKHKEILEKFITKEIHVVHEGIDPEIFNTQNSYKMIDTGKLTFITVGKNEKRKNTSKIIKTFIENFQYEEVALICHTFNPFIQNKDITKYSLIDPGKYGFTYSNINNSIHKFSNGICDIYFTPYNIPTPQMNSLYHSANVGIQVSSGEGWDLPLVELMACGLPCIASNCLGHSEYLEDENLPQIQQDLIIQPSGLELANDGHWFKGNQGSWSVIEENDIKTKIKHVIDNKNKYINKHLGLSEYIINNYNWDLAAEQIINIF